MKIKNKSKLLSFLGRWLFQILFFLNKISIKGEENLIKLLNSGKPIMLCVWHGRLLYPSWYIRFHAKIHIVSSKHPDSEILGNILKYWGYTLIKGSTKKGGMKVIKEMTKIFDNGGMIAITNDGPRGPAKIAKPGSIKLALQHNAYIISMSCCASKYWNIPSWDKTMIPQPFSTIHVKFDEPMDYEKTKNEVEALNNYLNNNLSALDKSII